MGTGQREAGTAVIECCRGPCRSRVARYAIMIKIIRRVIGIRCGSEISGVARVTGRRRICIA